MKNNYLLLVDNKNLISKLKEESNITFLFPIKDFTVGFNHAFTVDEIKEENAFIFVNRLLDHKGILAFKSLLKKLPSNIKGIVFDDIGVLEVLKITPNSLVKILFLNHFNCNFVSINAYLEDCDSVLVSTDITKEEVKTILEQALKPLVLYTFGHINIMYSRRKLITNYNEHFQTNAPLVSDLTNDLKQEFKIVENEYGTVIYTGKPFNGLYMRGSKNVLYYLINTVFLSDEEVIDIINSSTDLTAKYDYTYLSENETIVRIKER